MEYHKDGHPTALTDKFEEFRREGKFCDFELTCGGPVLKVHHLVLAAASPVFEVTLSAGCKEFRLDFVDPELLELLVDFMYTGIISVPSTKVQALMCAAHFLELDDLVKASADYLASQLRPSNILSIFRSAKECNQVALMSDAQRCYNSTHRGGANQWDDFLGLSKDQFLELLAIPEFERRNDQELVGMCVGWLRHEPERAQHCATVLDRVPHVDSYWLIAELRNVQEPGLARVLAHYIHLKEPEMANPTLYVVGGRLQLPGGAVEVTASALKYEVRTGAWSDIAPMNTPRTAHGVAVLGGLVYAVGGEGGDDGDTTLASAEVYDPASDEWSTIPPMREARSHFGLAALTGRLYAFGGECDGRLKSSIEEYDPETREWVTIEAMPEPRSQMSVVAFNSRIYMAGGVVRTAAGGRALSADLLRYIFEPRREKSREHPEDLIICEETRHSLRLRMSERRRLRERTKPRIRGRLVAERLAPMRRARCALAAVVESHRGCLYALGGLDEEDYMRFVERYDFATNDWEDLEDLLEPRCTPAAAATLVALVAAGGALGRALGLEADVELYDLYESRWTPRGLMPWPRAGAGAASILSGAAGAEVCGRPAVGGR